MEWSDGQVILDDFVVQRELGEGGMGKVYLLKSRSTGMDFAVKRAKGLGDNDRRSFLAELQTWIDLPDHPNLVPCRFFRTIGDEIIIFAEYVQGGSLKDWISSRRLYEGGKEVALERVLDIAIQMAWGLHCVHELGLIHQDVKPANMLISLDKQIALQGLCARVSDYGLAKARAVAGELYMRHEGDSILVSSGGYTPAYCSPEQANCGKLNRGTDLWSWGVSVLEMFQGGVTWQSGKFAHEALEAHIEHYGEDKDIPAMPEELVIALRECFKKDSTERWSFEALVEWMKDVYDYSVGREYERSLKEIRKHEVKDNHKYVRRTRNGAAWQDPKAWIVKGLKVSGKSEEDALAVISRFSLTRMGSLVYDITLYQEAKRIYEDLIKSGKKSLESDLALLCHEAALVYETAGDSSGAIEMYDTTIRICEKIADISSTTQSLQSLAMSYANKATYTMNLGDSRLAISLYDKAIIIRERMINKQTNVDLAASLAMTYQNKGAALNRLKENRLALEYFDKAIDVHSRYITYENRNDLKNELARLHANKGLLLSNLSNRSDALEEYEKAIGILEEIVEVKNDKRYAYELSSIYISKSIDLKNVGGNLSCAIKCCDKAIAIRERLVIQENRLELESDLAMAYYYKASPLFNNGNNSMSIDYCNRAINILESLIYSKNNLRFLNELANVYTFKGAVLAKSNDNRNSILACSKAIEILKQLVNEGREELKRELISSYINKGIAEYNLKEFSVAIASYDESLNIIGDLQKKVQSRELSCTLAKIYLNKANAVSSNGNILSAIEIYDMSIKILENEYLLDGKQFKIMRELSMAYSNKAYCLMQLEKLAESIKCYDLAITLKNEIFSMSGITQNLTGLAVTNCYRGIATIKLGNRDEGLQLLKEWREFLYKKISESNKDDLQKIIKWIEEKLKSYSPD
jgi:serine/threonine protein kinase